MPPKISIISTHWAMNEGRSDTMRASYNSLFFTTPPETEIIIIDNGESLEDSKWLLEKTHEGKIATYIRNRKNMHFGFGRNQGLKLASGDYIVIADNDIFYTPGWLEICVDFLERNPGKHLATPLIPDTMNATRDDRWAGAIGAWKLNYRAGSNCFVMRRKDFEEIGFFDIHRIAGSKFTDRYIRKGYLMAVIPRPRAFDMGFRQGYNLKEPIPHKTL